MATPIQHDPQQFIDSMVEGLSKMLGGREAALAFLPQVMAPFLEDAKRLLPELRLAVSLRDKDAMEKKAHTLKGKSGMMGIDSLFELFKEFVDLVRADEIEQAVRRLPAIEAEYLFVSQTIQTFIEEQNS